MIVSILFQNSDADIERLKVFSFLKIIIGLLAG